MRFLQENQPLGQMIARDCMAYCLARFLSERTMTTGRIGASQNMPAGGSRLNGGEDISVIV
jgi:hypothetical protein